MNSTYREFWPMAQFVHDLHLTSLSSMYFLRSAKRRRRTDSYTTLLSRMRARILSPRLNSHQAMRPISPFCALYPVRIALLVLTSMHSADSPENTSISLPYTLHQTFQK